MRESTAVKRCPALGMASMGLAMSMSSTASAEVMQAGAWRKDGRAFAIRTSPSTSASKIDTISRP